MQELNIQIDTDPKYHRKAHYVFTMFCRFLGINANIYFTEGKYDAHIYYGENLHIDRLIYIYHNPQVVDFFQSAELYPAEKVDFATYEEVSLPFLFSPQGIINRLASRHTYIYKDIISSAFYFLSGWQEQHQTGDLYEHRDSLQCKCGFTEIPFIDYYVNILREALLLAGFDVPSEKRNLLSVSHDLDYFNYWTKEHLYSVYRHNIRTFTARPAQAIYKFLGHFLTKQFFYNPEKILSKILEKEEKYGVHSTTFLLAKACNDDIRQDYLSDDFYLQQIKEIFAHRSVGLHGTKNASYDESEMSLQWERLKATGLRVTGYRNHYLYFNYHQTFAYLERLGVSYDATLGFREHIGYRVGTSRSFYPYNIVEDRPFTVLEYPLIVMDVTLFSPSTMHLSYKDARQKVFDLIHHARQTGGQVSLLWHIHNFDFIDHPGWERLFWEIIKVMR